MVFVLHFNAPFSTQKRVEFSTDFSLMTAAGLVLDRIKTILNPEDKQFFSIFSMAFRRTSPIQHISYTLR
jgi:hypothetical protein